MRYLAATKATLVVVSTGVFRLWLTTLAIISFSISGCSTDNDNTFVIDGDKLTLNGVRLTTAGSFDELVAIIGPPDYAWSPEVPHVVFWQKLGLEVSVFDGCVGRFVLRISPLKAEDLSPFAEEDNPGDRPLPAFPGRVELDGVRITPNLSINKLKKNKRPPKFNSGILLAPAIKVKGKHEYMVVVDQNYIDRSIKRISFSVKIKEKCNAEPIFP